MTGQPTLCQMDTSHRFSHSELPHVFSDSNIIMIRHYAKCITCMGSFTPANNPKRQMSLPPFYRWRNWDLEKTIYLSSVTQIVSSGARIQTQVCPTPRKMLWTTLPTALSESQSPCIGNRPVHMGHEVQNQPSLF